MDKQKIRQIIEKTVGNDLSKSVTEIKDNENLFLIGVDSINFINIIIGIEDTLHIEFLDQDIARENWESVNSIFNLVEKKANEIH